MIFGMYMHLKTYFKNSVPSWDPLFLTQRVVTIALKNVYATPLGAPDV